MGDERIIISLKAMSQSGRKILNVLGVKEEHYWDFVEVDKFICLIVHNQINLGNNFL